VLLVKRLLGTLPWHDIAEFRKEVGAKRGSKAVDGEQTKRIETGDEMEARGEPCQ